MANPRPATAVLIDIRDFTPLFTAFTERGQEAEFAAFIDGFYRACTLSCRESYPGADPGDALLLSSTGDGMLAVFEDRAPADGHVLRAYLACLRLIDRLPPLFSALDGVASTPGRPRFGIGMESGMVIPVGDGAAGGPRTVLGHCINIAARLEALTKTVAATSLVIGEASNRVLTRALHGGVDYRRLQRAALDTMHDEAALTEVFAKMREANDAVGVFWFGSMNLKGVKEPLAAFRSSATLLSRGREARMAAVSRLLGL